jgi:UDP-N-acetylmuramate dehydrogenase
LACCHAEGIPVHFLGRGSNVLVADEGVPGLTIGSPRTLLGLGDDEGRLSAEAGVNLPDLARHAATLGLSGFEFMIGIPGTVGAGVVMNAGVGGGDVREMAQIVDEIEICDRRGKVRRIAAGAIQFSHRHTDLIERGDFVLRCWFRPGPRVARETIQARMRALLEYRRATQPLTKRTAGSTFKRPPGGEPAAVYIDRAGLKGFRIGGARVSPRHANFIETEEGAKAADVRELIAHVDSVVSAQLYVHLEVEVQYLPGGREAAGNVGRSGRA